MVAFESEGRLHFEDNGGTVAVRRAKLGDQVITITITITIAITKKNMNNIIPGSLGMCGNSLLGEGRDRIQGGCETKSVWVKLIIIMMMMMTMIQACVQ